MKRLLAAFIMFSLVLTTCACHPVTGDTEMEEEESTVTDAPVISDDMAQAPTSPENDDAGEANPIPPIEMPEVPEAEVIKNPREEVLICLDAGHGLIDPGAIGYLNGSTYYEKSFNLAIARRTKEKLESLGYRVMMIRSGDTSLLGGSNYSATYKTADEAVARRKLGKEAGASLYLSIHCNAYEGTSRAYGPLVFYNSSSATTYRALSLAKTFSASFTKANEAYPTARSCDIREGNSYIVLKELSMPALLLEIGFMTDEGDLALLNRADWQSDCAGAIAEGVEKAFLGGLIE